MSEKELITLIYPNSWFPLKIKAVEDGTKDNLLAEGILNLSEKGTLSLSKPVPPKDEVKPPEGSDVET